MSFVRSLGNNIFTYLGMTQSNLFIYLYFFLSLNFFFFFYSVVFLFPFCLKTHRYYLRSNSMFAKLVHEDLVLFTIGGGGGR